MTRSATYVIDDRRYIENQLSGENRLDHGRIREITDQIRDFRAIVRIEGNDKTAVIRHIGGPNRREIISGDCPLYISDVTIPEICQHFRGQPLPNKRSLPYAVIEIRESNETY